MSWDTAPYSVCVIMPPKDLWAPFVDIKKNHMNPKIKRPPYPHITLLAPFAHPKHYVEAKKTVREALKSIEPFEINFASFKLFNNTKSATMYLAPESSTELEHLHEVLSSSVPESVTQKQNDFEAHIGVGYFKNSRDAEQLKKKYQETWQPLKFVVQEVYFLSRSGQEMPWQVQEIVSLGSTEALTNFKIGDTTDSSK
jgi:2'-5' RNA ligase